MVLSSVISAVAFLMQRDFASDVAQKSDVYAVDELRNLLFDPPVSLDLIAIDIQRERDLGLGTLNETREALGLTPYTDFNQITSDPVVLANLQQVFGTVDNIDLFIGEFRPRIPRPVCMARVKKPSGRLLVSNSKISAMATGSGGKIKDSTMPLSR